MDKFRNRLRIHFCVSDVRQVERPTADWRLCEFLGFLELRRQIFHRRRQQPSPQPGIRHTEQPERRLAPTGKSNTLVPAPTWQMYSGACTHRPTWLAHVLTHAPTWHMHSAAHSEIPTLPFVIPTHFGTILVSNIKRKLQSNGTFPKIHLFWQL